MKKFALALASMLLVLSAAGAVAAVPSKTTTDVTRVKAVESTEPTMLIEVTEDAAPVVEEIEKIYQHVAVKGQAAIAYFPVETQNEIIALLPEGVKGSALTMNEFVTLCARDRLPMIWIQDTTGIDVGNDAEKAELLGLGQSLIYSIQSSKLPMMEITLRRGTAAAHYVLGGPQGNDNNAFSLGTAATEINVMNGKTAANAMYTGRLAKDQKAGKDLQPTIDKMNALIDDYDLKSKPLFCAQAGLVDEVVDLPMMRNYIVAFTDAVYQNPESICPFHQMLLPRTIKDFDTFKK